MAFRISRQSRILSNVKFSPTAQQQFFESTESKPETKTKTEESLRISKQPERLFETGSKYIGEWNKLGMNGEGTYTLFNESKYVGSMKDGRFHGKGVLHFPNNSRIEGTWKNGELCEYDYFFADGMKHDPQPGDRRYNREIKEGLKPAGRPNLTEELPTRKIPEGWYDTYDGFYNPKTKCVVDANDYDRIIRIPTAKEHEWILRNCRTSGDSHVGYRPEYYEQWVYPTEWQIESDVMRKLNYNKTE